MDWVTSLIFIFALLSILFLIGVPVAFSFIFVNMLFAFGSRNAELLFELNNRFHWLITSETGNGYLMDIRSNFRGLIDHIAHIFPRIPGQMEATITDHRRIISALKSHNPALAEFVMREHLETAKKHLLAYLRDGRTGSILRKHTA